MAHLTIRKYAMMRSRFIDWDLFTAEYPWATQQATTNNLPEKCVSIYYSVDLDKQTITDRLCMVTYEKKYQSDFKKISVEWVSKYFSVETGDLAQLDKAEENIVKPGGEVFCLLNSDDTVVGTVAMILEEGGSVELAKLGVKTIFNGKGYAHPLMNECILWAKHRDYTFINLYTATKLAVARALYEKYNFQLVLDSQSHFARADLAMRLTF